MTCYQVEKYPNAMAHLQQKDIIIIIIIIIIIDMFSESLNCEASRDSRCYETALQTRPLLGNDSVEAVT
jgi:hypothetical protein